MKLNKITGKIFVSLFSDKVRHNEEIDGSERGGATKKGPQ